MAFFPKRNFIVFNMGSLTLQQNRWNAVAVQQIIPKGTQAWKISL
jgi:hypothetical protein